MESETERYFRISIQITVGEYEHSEDHFFYGTYPDARTYADSYLRDIWGIGETKETDEGYETLDGTQVAVLSAIYPSPSIPVMSAKGAFHAHLTAKEGE